MSIKSLFLILVSISVLAACASTDDRDLSPYESDAGVDTGIDAEGDVEAEDANGDIDDAGDLDDAGPDASDEDADEPVGPCRFGADDQIEADQVPMEPGLSANFQMALDVTLDTAGEVIDGTRTWDLSEDFDGDEVREVMTLDPAEEWFGDDFPDATYAVGLSADSDLLGVFQATDESLLLVGVVSPEDTGAFSRTRLTYDPPVEILQFPLHQYDNWSTESLISGTAQGVASAYRETYTTEVDRRGEMITPYGVFDVLRVRTTMERTSGGFPLADSRTFAFVSPCFGTVATIVSEDGESQVDFDQASEVRRLAP